MTGVALAKILAAIANRYGEVGESMITHLAERMERSVAAAEARVTMAKWDESRVALAKQTADLGVLQQA